MTLTFKEVIEYLYERDFSFSEAPLDHLCEKDGRLHAINWICTNPRVDEHVAGLTIKSLAAQSSKLCPECAGRVFVKGGKRLSAIFALAPEAIDVLEGLKSESVVQDPIGTYGKFVSFSRTVKEDKRSFEALKKWFQEQLKSFDILQLREHAGHELAKLILKRALWGDGSIGVCFGPEKELEHKQWVEKTLEEQLSKAGKVLVFTRYNALCDYREYSEPFKKVYSVGDDYLLLPESLRFWAEARLGKALVAKVEDLTSEMLETVKVLHTPRLKTGDYWNLQTVVDAAKEL